MIYGQNASLTSSGLSSFLLRVFNREVADQRSYSSTTGDTFKASCLNHLCLEKSLLAEEYILILHCQNNKFTFTSPSVTLLFSYQEAMMIRLCFSCSGLAKTTVRLRLKQTSFLQIRNSMNVHKRIMKRNVDN